MRRNSVLTAVIGLGLVGCGSGEGETSVVSAGQALFEANCAECHGERALGDGPTAETLPVDPPSLMDHLGHHPLDQLITIIRTGVPPAMPPAPLTEDEVRLVVDYVWTLVPDSMVESLRDMQHMAEMGMDMGDMGMPMDSSGGMGMMRDSSGAMPMMKDSSHQAMPRDTTRH